MALGFREQGKLRKAITVLEDGTERAPAVWVLWKLLGDSNSDAGRYVEAENAYQTALRLDGCDFSLVHLNRAIAFKRRGNFSEAKDTLKRIKSASLLQYAHALKTQWHVQAGEIENAVRSAKKLALGWSESDSILNEEIELNVRLACAEAFSLRTREADCAIVFAKSALKIDPTNQEAFAVLRAVRARKSPDARRYTLVLEGKWDSKSGFFRNCQVIARNEILAFEYASDLETPSRRSSLVIESMRCEKKKRPDELEGVYWMSGYMLYPLRKKK